MLNLAVGDLFFGGFVGDLACIAHFKFFGAVPFGNSV
jgi:hypothetical protein